MHTPEWSDEEFCQRIARRCDELGLSQREVLEEAQVAHDYLQTKPSRGRRLDLVLRLATALKWTLPQIMGIELTGNIDPVILMDAFRHAKQATRKRDTSDAVLVHIVATLYNVIVDRRAGKRPVDLADVADALAISGSMPAIAETPNEAPESRRAVATTR